MGVVLARNSPIRVSLPRFHFRVGLHIDLFEVCSAFTRVAACTLARSPYVVTAIRRLQTLRLLHVCSGCFRLERSPGGAAPTGKAPPCPGARGKTVVLDWWRPLRSEHRPAREDVAARRLSV